MTQNEIDKRLEREVGESYQERIKKYFADRELTQADIDILNSRRYLKITEKQLCTEDIFYWLTKSEVLFSYEILEFFEQQNIQINQLPWTPAHLRLQNLVHIYNKIGKTIFRMHIGGNTAAVDWKWYDTQDYYFPDFDIYNDVTIQYFDGTCELWNYPEEQFPLVYAHSTVYDERTNKAYITGGLGSGDRQRKGITEIYQLDLESKDIQQIETFGESPPCLHNHETKMWNRDLIEMKGGNILKNGIAIKNLYVWYFNLKTKAWLPQESEKYQHWVIRSVGNGELFLEICRNFLNYEDTDLTFVEEYKQDMLKWYKYIPDYQLYPNLCYVNEDMYFSKMDGYPYEFPIYQCILNGQVYHYFEEHNRLEVAFQASASDEFQKFIINDLTSKLKQISGHDVVAEKVA